METARLGTDAPYLYWVQRHNARVCSGDSLPEGAGRGEGEGVLYLLSPTNSEMLTIIDGLWSAFNPTNASNYFLESG